MDLSHARTLLRTRAELTSAGFGERDLRAGVASGALRRVRRNRYIDASHWDQLWGEGRHLVEVAAANENCTDAVFFGPSAAVLHGLPLYRYAPRQVHALIRTRRHGRDRAGIAWHNTTVCEEDIVEVDGILCTSLDRTVLDLCRNLSAEAALSAADAALRHVSVSGQRLDADAAADWHERMARRAAFVHGRGIRAARELIDFADGRAQLPGESVSRLYLWRLGYRDVTLQTPVTGPLGEQYWLDFGFPRSRTFGEFDGESKYLDINLRGALSPEDVMLAEKRREDAIRGVTGWRVVRWMSEHIRSVDVFADRLHSFGLRPPG